MFKPVHAAIGTLDASLTAVSNIMVADDNLTAALIGALTSGVDHTYVKIGDGAGVEVVKVAPTGGVLAITRAQDGTTAGVWAVGTCVEYLLCSAAVTDMIDTEVSPNNISITGSSPIVVEDLGSGAFEISIEDTVITSTDGTINITGTYPEFNIEIERGAFGCCGS